MLIDQVEGTTKVVINNKTYGPFSSLYNYYLSNDGSRWAIIYNDTPNEFYAIFNDGKKIGPYKSVIDFYFLEGKADLNRWVLLTEPIIEASKTIKGQRVEAFTVVTNTGEIGNFEQRWLGNPAFDYRNMIIQGANYGLTVIKDQSPYFLANDKLFGPYLQPVVSVDMGREYNKFNYIDPNTRNLHFTGDGIFSRNVSQYFVSESRKTIVIIKKAGANKDSLSINDKYFKGIFNKIYTVKFAPNSEEWVALCDDGNGTFSLHFSDGRKYEGFEVDLSHGHPTLLLGKEAKNWAFYYVEAKSGKNMLLVNNKPKSQEFIGNIAIIKEADKEYFSWFSLDEKTVFLNKLLLE